MLMILQNVEKVFVDSENRKVGKFITPLPLQLKSNVKFSHLPKACSDKVDDMLHNI